MKNKLIAVFLFLSGAVLADPPTTRTLDFASATPAPALELYKGDTRTLIVNLLNDNQSGSLSNSYAPLLYFYGFSTVGVACAWISSNSFQAVFSTNDLATAGTYYYCGGVSNSNGGTVAQRGTLTITAH